MFIDYTANSGVISWLYCYLAMNIIFGVLINMSHTCMYHIASYSYNRKIACLHEAFGAHMDLTA